MHSTLTQLAVQSVAHLAARCEYRAAGLLIESLAKGEMPASLRMLHAKILVQQGKYPEALDAWRELLRQEPQNQEAQAALRRTEKLAQSRWHRLGRYSTGFKGLILATLLAAGVLAAGAFSGFSFAPLGNQAAAESSAPAIGGPEQRSIDADLIERAADLERTVREQTAVLGNQLKALEESVQHKLVATVSAEDAATQAAAGLREPLPGPEKTSDQQTSQAVTSMEARLAALEKSVQAQNERFGQAEKHSADEARYMHRTVLLGRLSDLCARQPLAEADVTMIRLTARALLDLARDPESEDYARRVIQWTEKLTIPPSDAGK